MRPEDKRRCEAVIGETLTREFDYSFGPGVPAAFGADAVEALEAAGFVILSPADIERENRILTWSDQRAYDEGFSEGAAAGLREGRER